MARSENLTHDDLVAAARSWLWKCRCRVVATELVSGIEVPDALGFRSGGDSMLVECKTSLSDLRADFDKAPRKYPEMGYGDRRYYLVPEHLELDVLERIPEEWGLVSCKGKYGTGYSNRLVKLAEYVDKSATREISLLVSCLRRVGYSVVKHVEGMSVQWYTARTKNTATLGVDIDPLEEVD